MEPIIPPENGDGRPSDAPTRHLQRDIKDEAAPGWAAVRVGQPANGATITRIAALLARAFADDPEMIAALPDPQQRARRLPYLIGLNVRYGCLYGEVYTTPSHDGAAIWLPPGATTFTFGRIVRAGMLTAPLHVGWRALSRMATMEGFAARMHHRLAPMPHWYLAQIGVEPSRQGRGIGSTLLGPMLSRIDAEQSWCYLETAKHANIAFYERRGFRVADDGQTHAGGPHIWGLLRDPA